MATKKEALEQSQRAIKDFFQLSEYLLGDNAPYDINEIPEDSPFYETAKAIADECELDWKQMSHEDSNRVMLNMLSEYFCTIQPDGEYESVITISFKKSK